MSLRYLLDTDVVSGLMYLRPDPTLVAWFNQHRAEAAIATTTWHELWFGCYRLPVSTKRDFYQDYLTETIAAMPILAYDARAAGWHALERARLTKLGKTPAFMDGQIAAVAATNELALLTFNVSDFRYFADLALASLADE